MTPTLFLALALPLYAQPSEAAGPLPTASGRDTSASYNAAVARVMARVETLVAAQKGKDAREIRDLDQKAESLYAELKPLGWKAAPALGAAAQDLRRPPKVRLFAASYLALIRDPAAFPPLEDILLNSEQEPYVRSLAAQSLPGQGAPDAAVGRALCEAVSQENLPREVLAEVLLPLSRLGCPDPAALVRIARSFGPRPNEKDEPLAGAALAALGHSRGAASGKALLALVDYFPARGAPRAAAIQALDARRAEIAAWLAPEALPVVVDALRSESSSRGTMIPLVRLAAALGPEGGRALLRLTLHPDPEVLAEAAEALAAFKLVEAIPPLEAVIAGAMSDPRFSPQEGRPDPAATLARLEKAVAALRRAR